MKTKKTMIRVLSAIVTVLILFCICVMATGCAPVDADMSEGLKVQNTKSEYAIVRFPDDTIIRGNVDHKYMYSNGCIKITIDGVEYYTHIANVAIIESSK